MRPVAGQRADVPLRRRHGEEPRRLGLARRPRLLRRRRLPVSQRPSGRHVHRRRPQRLPRRDRIGAVGAPGCVVLLGGRRPRRRSRSGAVRDRAGRRARRSRRAGVPAPSASPATRCRAPSSSSTPRCATTQARHAGRRCATRSSRDGRLGASADRASQAGGMGRSVVSQRRNATRHGDSTSA